jgi:hypothetical protein
MLRLLTAIGTFLSVFAANRTGSETGSPTTRYRVLHWPAAVKAHNQFDNWT